MQIIKFLKEKTEFIRLENNELCLEVAPSVGGKITSIYSKSLLKEFLWTNHALKLQPYPVGTDYDSHFFGGIDELLPCDIPELVQGMAYPDHGELWTLNLECQIVRSTLMLSCRLPLSGLYYEKVISLDESKPLIHIDYTIRNEAGSVRYFLWKLHAALQIREGDRMQCFVSEAQVVDPEYSRYKSTQPFNWPTAEGTNASIVPAKDGSMDFYYLYGVEKGEMSLISSSVNSRFTYFFDDKVFPYLWFFASYGGFLGHYTVILEPCTTMPISLNEAIKLKQCSVLAPGESIKTRVSIYAGSHFDPI